jgi:hypothetical protein
MNESYLEKCIQSLPAEKQAAARAAFRDIAETGGDNVFSKVLVTLEATSAYAATIPQDMTVRGEKLLGELDARVARLAQEQAETETRREERLHKLITAQLPQLGKSLALDNVVAGLATLTAAVGRFERTLSLFRRARVGALLFYVFIGGVIGAALLGGVFRTRYQSAQRAERFINRLYAEGISIEARRTEQGEWLKIEGPAVLAGSTFKRNGNGEVTGAHLLFPTGGSR